MTAVLIGIEAVARLMLRCAVYERLYLTPGLGLTVCQNLQVVLESVYTAILAFLAFAKRYLDRSSSSMSPSCGHILMRGG